MKPASGESEDALNDQPPTLYQRYIGHIYRITIVPRGVEVARLKAGNALAAKSISFGSVPRLHAGRTWNTAVAEKLIDRYEQQLASDQDQDKDQPLP